MKEKPSKIAKMSINKESEIWTPNLKRKEVKRMKERLMKKEDVVTTIMEKQERLRRDEVWDDIGASIETGLKAGIIAATIVAAKELITRIFKK